MRKQIGVVLALALIGLGLAAPNLSAAVSTFDETRGSAAVFDGGDDHFLTFSNSAYVNMSGNDFTISWWQQTTSYQFLYPRIMQFGAGHNHTDSFAISEENDGNIYLWINGINVTSMPIPGMFDWHHIALTRSGDTFRWFLDGTYFSQTEFTPVIPCDGCLSKFAFFTTSTLNLLIGGGDDPITGSFIGNIAGFQISQSVRWPTTSSFNPPTNFLNPDSGLAFSSYGSRTDITDRSSNLLPVTNPGIGVTDFDPPSPSPTPVPSPSPSDSPSPTPDPSPSPSDSPSPTPDPSTSPSPDISPSPGPQTGSTIGAEFFGWNSTFEITRDQTFDPFDYRGIVSVAMGVSVQYTDSDNNFVKTRCYINLANRWETINEGELMNITLPTFYVFVHYLFPEDCTTPPDQNHPNGLIIPEYRVAMFGQNQTRVDFVLWTEMPASDTDVNSAFERLYVDLAIPPEITSYTITRGSSAETDTERISFGDTLTVTVANAIATDSVIMHFNVPESYSPGGSNSQTHWCSIPIDPEPGGEFGRSFRLPTFEVFIAACRSVYEGDWVYAEYEDHFFDFSFWDSAHNESFPVSLTLNPLTVVDWSQFPTTVYAPDPLWDSTYILNKEPEAPPFNFHKIKNVSIGIPIDIANSDQSITHATCYLNMSGAWDWIDGDSSVAWGLSLEMPGFHQLINEIIPDDCLNITDSEHPNGVIFPHYQIGLLGETQTNLVIYLWTSENVTDYSDTQTAFEEIPFSVLLPPEIEELSVIRGDVQESDPYVIHSTDIIQAQVRNIQNAIGINLWIHVPEAFNTGSSPNPMNWCPIGVETSSPGGVSNDFVIPSMEQVSSQCHEEFDGNWIFDLTADHDVAIDYYDREGNGGVPNIFTLRTAVVPSNPVPAPTPPAPTPPAPIEEVNIAIPMHETPTVLVESDVVIVADSVAPEKNAQEEQSLTVTKIPKKVSEVVGNKCLAAGIWVFNKSGRLQICNSAKRSILDIKACTGKSGTPTYPWIFRAYRFKPGYLTSQNGLKLFYSVFFYKGLSITGVNKVSSKPCSHGSVFIEKKYAKVVYDYALKNKPLIWVRDK